MKRRTLLILTGVLMSLVFLLGGCKNMEIKELESFAFSYTTGNAMDASVSYELRLDDGVYTAVIKDDGVPLEEADIIETDQAFADRLAAFLHENKVERWNGFKKVNWRVLDGKSFSLALSTKDGKSLSAHGYMRWPKQYKEVKAGIENLFNTLREEK